MTEIFLDVASKQVEEAMWVFYSEATGGGWFSDQHSIVDKKIMADAIDRLKIVQELVKEVSARLQAEREERK